MVNAVVLVIDKVYQKTTRYLHKLMSCHGAKSPIVVLAIATGFDAGLPSTSVSGLVSRVVEGTVEEIAEQLRRAFGADPNDGCAIVGLNQSSVLPTLAVRRLLGHSTRGGLIEACDKRITRLLLSRTPALALAHCEALPGTRGSANHFMADRYVVKPAFGMSSSDVRVFRRWGEAASYAESPGAKHWIPEHVREALAPEVMRTDARIIEAFVDGVEFSIDGWLHGGNFWGIVQHKLSTVNSSFIGDGPTISPPARPEHLSDGWSGLRNDEDTLCGFGRRVLAEIGFLEGVFHIEARERGDGSLALIEVNPRAPGGSLWRTALLRSGFDLELVDALIQLGISPAQSKTELHGHVLHYPFYAPHAGTLTHWGEIAERKEEWLSVDLAACIGDEFRDADMLEEPYLAFAVAWDDAREGLLRKCATILSMNPPVIARRP